MSQVIPVAGTRGEAYKRELRIRIKEKRGNMPLIPYNYPYISRVISALLMSFLAIVFQKEVLLETRRGANKYEVRIRKLQL